jgi:hypothetical protein
MGVIIPLGVAISIITVVVGAAIFITTFYLAMKPLPGEIRFLKQNQFALAENIYALCLDRQRESKSLSCKAPTETILVGHNNE